MLQWLAGIEIIKNHEVWNTVIRVIQSAREELYLVSPYNEYSVPFSEELGKAAQSVSVVAVCRQEQKGKENAHFEWLRSIGADVHLVSRLHAKIYFNESTAIVTSMNLSKGSATDSKEIGFVISDKGMRDQIRDYVERDLIAHGQHLAPTREGAKPKPRAARSPRTKPRSHVQGSCIRCGEASIAYNPSKPFCPECFRSWDKDPDHPERHCHRCGERRKTSFVKPLCLPCYKAEASRS